MTSIKRPKKDLFAEQHSLAQPGTFTILCIQAEFSIPEVSRMCITFIRNSSKPRGVTLKITLTIHHLHLSAWHFGKIQQLYKKKSLQIFDFNPFDLFFFLSVFMGQRFKKKHSYCLMKTAGNALHKQRTALQFPFERPEF